MIRNVLYGTLAVAILLILIVLATPSKPKSLTVQSDTSTQSKANLANVRASQSDQQNPLYPIVKVVDGDTITVDIDGAPETIRLIGIDTPETVDPRKTVQCFGKEASDTTKALLSGRKVTLERDGTQDERDKYGRLLAYVYRDDGLFINKYLVEQGFAHEYTYNLPYNYQAEFRAAQKTAQTEHRGLWAPGVCDSSVAPSPAPAVASAPPQDVSKYSCAGNLYDCTDFSSHTEAQAVYEMCGGANNDVHNLDRDKDGDACESLP